MKKLTLTLIFATCIAATGWSKDLPAYEKTGTIAIKLSHESTTHFTTWNSVPGAPERQIHTASWVILKPMLLGGVNLPEEMARSLPSQIQPQAQPQAE